MGLLAANFLLLLLKLFAAAALASGCPSSCGDITFSYPFGIGPGCFRPGFELTCDSIAHPPKLFLGDGTIEIVNSIDINTYRIEATIATTIAMKPGVITDYAFSVTPHGLFALDDMNKLIVIGCDIKAYLFDLSTNETIGYCATACPTKEAIETQANDICKGIGCCSISYQEKVRASGLRVVGHTRSDMNTQAGTLSSTVKVFVTSYVYNFRPMDLFLDVMNTSKAAVGSAMLSWAILDQPTCESATKENESYACISSKSDCYNALGEGYYCGCSIDYTGNPYVPGGCSSEEQYNGVYNPIQSNTNCSRECDNVSIPFPFGLEPGCFAREGFRLTCRPPLQFNEEFQVTGILLDEGILHLNRDAPIPYNDDDLTSYDYAEDRRDIRWIVDNSTCQKANQNMRTYACISNHSTCLDVANETNNIVGYRCKCSNGFQGNPYILDGCTDIDECKLPDKYICHGTCHNYIGGFECTKCRHGTEFDPLKRLCSTTKQHQDLLLGVVIGTSSGIGFLLLFLGVVLLVRKWKRSAQNRLRKRHFCKNQGLLLEQLISSNESATDNTKIFSLEELEKATNNFDPALVLGCGGHGMVYKGILSDQRVVAIKKSKITEQIEIKQFVNEVAVLSQISHRHVVKLFGCCLEAEVPLLVYEFISNGTLHDHLHIDPSNDHSLPWEDRIRISAEAAGALSYLHSASIVSIFHRDVKSSNILLDDNFTTKVSDFGASRSIPIDQTRVVTAVQGTFGYLDPEYYRTCQLTEKSDVYSFGVILVEILVRKKPIFVNEWGEKQNLSNYFLQQLKAGTFTSIVDAQVLEEAAKDEIEEMAQLAEVCLRLRGEERPTMKEVEMRLQLLRNKMERRQLARERDEELKALLPSTSKTNSQVPYS